MAKVILVCGKVCSGKSTYAKAIKEKYNAILLSYDELMQAVLPDQQTEVSKTLQAGIQEYLFAKSEELIKADVSVIMDLGFETREDRMNASTFYHQRQIEFEWHYVEDSERIWKKNILNRNQKIRAGILKKDILSEEQADLLAAAFEEPKRYEIDKHIIVEY